MRRNIYAQTMARAVAAAANGNGEETERLTSYADQQLWPLDELSAGELRDFVAGAAREGEDQVHRLLSSNS